MVSTFTPNIQLEEPARGDQVGVWDTPVNSNMTVIDKVVGGVSVVLLNNSPVVLSAAQFQSRGITFASTLTGNVTITFPSSFSKDYLIFNVCTGSSAFVVTLVTSAGGQAICAPPGEGVSVFSNGAGGVLFENLGRIGSYVDYAGSSMPNWVTGCSVPPYLNCDGSVFSAGTFPTLATILGGTTLPDFRGRAHFTSNQGTGRLTTAGAGIDGNTIGAGGGNNGINLSLSQIPSIPSAGSNVITVTGPTNFDLLSVTAVGGTVFSVGVGSPTATLQRVNSAISAGTNAISVNYTNGGQAIVPSPIPGAVGGIRMIRSA